MSKVYFISDLHLGHKNILQFSPQRGGHDVITHSKWLVDQWNSVVTKNDSVWVLGDVCFDKDHMKYLKQMKGQKNLILGNHDKFGLEVYQQYFNKIHGFMKYKGFWLSHSPIHPQELRGKLNIHGHVHSKDILTTEGYIMPDLRYLSVCVEATDGVPMDLDDLLIIREGFQYGN